MLRPDDFAELTTPSAPLRWLRDFLLLAQPPLLFKEGKRPLFSKGESLTGIMRSVDPFKLAKGGVMYPRSVVPGLITSLVLVCAQPAGAHVKKIVIDKKVSPAFDAAFGKAGQYETLAGRAFGELDPKDPHNTIITDIQLA